MLWSLVVWSVKCVVEFGGVRCGGVEYGGVECKLWGVKCGVIWMQC